MPWHMSQNLSCMLMRFGVSGYSNADWVGFNYDKNAGRILITQENNKQCLVARLNAEV